MKRIPIKEKEEMWRRVSKEMGMNIFFINVYKIEALTVKRRNHGEEEIQSGFSI